MRISLESWKWLRDFTRGYLGLEAPSGDITAYYFRDLRDALKAKTSDEKERQEALCYLASEMAEQDRDLFLEGFRDVERKVAELDARRPPDYAKISRSRIAQKPSKADAPLRAKIKQIL
jgi:hypothetical protein